LITFFFGKVMYVSRIPLYISLSSPTPVDIGTNFAANGNSRTEIIAWLITARHGQNTISSHCNWRSPC
jgi:hypothetical protein